MIIIPGDQTGEGGKVMIEIPHEEIKQGSPEWFHIRCGVITASHFQEIVTTTGEPSMTRSKYMDRLYDELISGEPAKEKFKSPAMQKGTDREDEARRYFEFTQDIQIRQVGFVFLDDNRRVGCSPDGLIDPMCGFETKNAEPHVQRDRLESGMSRATHFQQCQGGLWVCEKEKWFLQSYSRGLQNIVIEYERDEKFISVLARRVHEFIDELDYMVQKWKV